MFFDAVENVCPLQQWVKNQNQILLKFHLEPFISVQINSTAFTAMLWRSHSSAYVVIFSQTVCFQNSPGVSYQYYWPLQDNTHSVGSFSAKIIMLVIFSYKVQSWWMGPNIHLNIIRCFTSFSNLPEMCSYSCHCVTSVSQARTPPSQRVK